VVSSPQTLAPCFFLLPPSLQSSFWRVLYLAASFTPLNLETVGPIAVSVFSFFRCTICGFLSRAHWCPQISPHGPSRDERSSPKGCSSTSRFPEFLPGVRSPPPPRWPRGAPQSRLPRHFFRDLSAIFIFQLFRHPPLPGLPAAVPPPLTVRLHGFVLSFLDPDPCPIQPPRNSITTALAAFAGCSSPEAWSLYQLWTLVVIWPSLFPSAPAAGDCKNVPLFARALMRGFPLGRLLMPLPRSDKILSSLSLYGYSEVSKKCVFPWTFGHLFVVS